MTAFLAFAVSVMATLSVTSKSVHGGRMLAVKQMVRLAIAEAPNVITATVPVYFGNAAIATWGIPTVTNLAISETNKAFVRLMQTVDQVSLPHPPREHTGWNIRSDFFILTHRLAIYN